VKESSRFFGPQGHFEIFIRKGEHMKNFLKPLLVAVGLGIFALVMALTNSKPVVAQTSSVPVRVTNTPLPITGNVNVTNASLPVTGSLSGLITNPANNPVLFSNVNDSVDREFSGSLCEADYSTPPDCPGNPIADPAGNVEFVNSFAAPTHTSKGLPVTQAVIEYVSGVCRADTTDDIVEVGISGLPSIRISPEAPVRTPGTPREVFPVPGQNSPTTWSFSHTTKIYLPPGTNISLFVRSTGEQNNLQRCYLNFWGTLLTK
jgi:hypothetical protein